jgi:TPR repeat protein
MVQFFRAFACRVLALFALLGIAQIVAAKEPDGPPEATVVYIDANGLDPLARRLSPKERSQRINLKTYSDEEWERLERELAADLAACDSGNAVACVNAGDAFLSGDGVWPIAHIAETLYKEACDAGAGEGCAALAALAETMQVGIQYEASPGFEDMHPYIEKACDLGHLESCDLFAWRLRGAGPEDGFRTRIGPLPPLDIARSDTLLESTCAKGGTEACLSLATLRLEGDAPGDLERATAMLDALCRDKVVAACQQMVSLAEGDEARINRYKDLGCRSGDASDCIDMNARAFKGIGGAPDRELAITYSDAACRIDAGYCEVSTVLRAMPGLRSACVPGDARACAALGRALAVVLSPEWDAAQAFALLEAACRAGVADACKDAAAAAREPERKSELLETGCTAGDRDACFGLAESLAEGSFGQMDEDRAVVLYASLCDAGAAAACEAESRFAGFVPAARIRPASEEYVAPLDSTQPKTWLDYTLIPDCFTASAMFRGALVIQENCSQREKGIGSERARPGQAPWQALLWRPATLNRSELSEAQRVLCGGSLIAPGWVLTAAHCLVDNKVDVVTGGHRIRLGVFNPQVDEGVSYPILGAFPHPGFDKGNKYLFDIALIRYDHRAPALGESSRASSRLPIAAITLDPLALGQRRIANGMPVYSFGWGWTAAEKSAATDYLQVIAMELVSEPVCTALTGFRKAFDNAALCAGGRKREQTCFGDSGGPLVTYGDESRRPVLIGVVSAGKKCGTTGRLSQYTRVAKVRDWIERTMRTAR